MVPHLDMMAALSSGGGAGPAFIFGLLGIDDKRGSNRGIDKRSHCSCNRGGTSPAFLVGLFNVDNKRGGQQGRFCSGRVAAATEQARRLLSACLVWRRGRGQEGQSVGNRGQQGATQARTTPARTQGRCAIEIGAIVLVTDVQGHSEW